MWRIKIGVMKTSDFICSCIGVDSDVIDKICDEFDVDLEDSDVLSAIRLLNGVQFLIMQ